MSRTADAMFRIGDLVALRSSPDTIFPVIEVIPGSGECRYRVFQNYAKATYYESQLQPAAGDADERRMLTAVEMRAYLTAVQILSPSTANPSPCDPAAFSSYRTNIGPCSNSSAPTARGC